MQDTQLRHSDSFRRTTFAHDFSYPNGALFPFFSTVEKKSAGATGRYFYRGGTPDRRAGTNGTPER